MRVSFFKPILLLKSIFVKEVLLRRILAASFFLMFPAFLSYGDTGPKVWNLSPENIFFVGRKEQLQKLSSLLNANEKRIVAITGGPGFGKTQTAKQFAQLFYKTYTIVWWIDAHQDIPHQFEKLALALNKILPQHERLIPSTLSKEALIDSIKDILRTKNVKYLLIVDNAETYSHIEKFIPVTHGQRGKHVLLTSRNATLWPDKVEIGKFKRFESAQLLEQALPSEKASSINRLAETLSDHPLSLTIAAAFIKTHPPTMIDKYIDLYLERTIKKGASFIKISDPLLENYTNDTQTALSVSLKFIEENSKEALHTLFFMSLLNSKDILDSYVDLWVAKTKGKMSPAEVIKLINDQSLVEIRTMDQDNKEPPLHFFSLHDLIHDLIQESIPMQQKTKLIDAAADVLLEVFSGPSDTFRKKIMKDPIHLLHAQTLCKNATLETYTSARLLQLKVCIFECLMGLRDFETAEAFLKDIEEDVTSGVRLEPYYEAVFAISKSYFKSWRTFNYEDSIYYLKKALNILTPLKDYRQEQLRVISNLIQAYSLKGELTIAEHFVSKGKEILQESQSDVYNYLFLYAWAIFLNDQGKFKDAEDIFKQAKRYTHLERDDPGTHHAILVQSAKTLIKQGRFQEAWKNLEECEKKSKAFFKKRKNPAFANIVLLKSFILIEERKFSAALSSLDEIFKFYEAYGAQGKKHRNQAGAHFALGKIYELQKNFKRAHQEYLKSDEIYSAVLTNKGIDDVSELYTALSLLGLKLNDETLTQMYLTAHMEVFGLHHGRTHTIMQTLDAQHLSPF